jgi:hypothetical protein
VRRSVKREPEAEVAGDEDPRDAPATRRAPGIDPVLLTSQVRVTAPWLLDREIDPPRGAAAAVSTLERPEDALASWRGETRDPTYLRLLLSAHWATVATFVPTDVDGRIRHTEWQAMREVEEIDAACAVVDEIAAFPAACVSERVVPTADGRGLSGHDGEWLSVRAGALGRAAALGIDRAREALCAAIEDELSREARAFEVARREGSARDVLSAATIIAHNLGDLSRVVERWPKLGPLAPLVARFARLGHEDAATHVPAFQVASVINKSIMAPENHRFLALRRARGLRRARALLLPVGPWFDAWGERIATSAVLSDEDRAEVVSALLLLHRSSPAELGCLRALAGIHHATPGGLDRYASDLPARIRRDVRGGDVRREISLPPERLDAILGRRLTSLTGSER